MDVFDALESMAKGKRMGEHATGKLVCVEVVSFLNSSMYSARRLVRVNTNLNLRLNRQRVVYSPDG